MTRKTSGGPRPSAAPHASAARTPFIDVAHGAVTLLTPEDAALRGAAVRPARHQDLEIAGRRDLASLLPPST